VPTLARNRPLLNEYLGRAGNTSHAILRAGFITIMFGFRFSAHTGNRATKARFWITDPFRWGGIQRQNKLALALVLSQLPERSGASLGLAFDIYSWLSMKPGDSKLS
jgi:hypothetical protein